MPTRVYLIRHGQTVDAHERRYKGHIDVPLSQEGIRQAQRMSMFLKSLDARTGLPPLHCIYCSDLSRAVKTAEAVAQPFGITPVVHSGLRERHFGKWEGMTFDEIKAAYPDEFKNWAADPLNFSPVGGESTMDVSLRLMPVFYGIVNSHKNETIALVAHGGVNRVALCHILGIPLSHIFRVEQDFIALNIIEFYDGVPVVKLMNFVPELCHEE
ncbi:MAG: histidine phosphatase family protein [Nitrospirae bacterium]|nr:histidine phosphatase family protein [Nitrospirota bacterium]